VSQVDLSGMLIILMFSQVIDAIRHSVEVIRDLPPDVQLKARLVYYEGLQYAFGASTLIALIATCSALLINGKGLRKTS
jgi:hypothetical protein